MAGERVGWLRDRYVEISEAIDGIVLGKPMSTKLAMTCVLAPGHLLIEDVPGTGKTSLAKAIAGVIDGTWRRIQFTPDLLPSDVTGSVVWNQRSTVFEFHPGPIFANVVVADEINRASPKTQSALLEVMEESQVTIEGTTYQAPEPFFVVATQNPLEYDGTYRLPEAQLDRFLMKISIGYPDVHQEVSVIASGGAMASLRDVVATVSTETVLSMIEIADETHVADELADYVVRLAQASRSLAADPQSGVRLGVSTRAVLGMIKAAKVWAALDGRDYVIPEDIRDLLVPVWAHRLLLDREAQFDGATSAEVLEKLATSVPVRTLVKP